MNYWICSPGGCMRTKRVLTLRSKMVDHVARVINKEPLTTFRVYAECEKLARRIIRELEKIRFKESEL